MLWGEGGAFCAGWDLKYCATMIEDAKQLHEIDYPLDDRKAIPRGPLGPTRLELDKPVIAAVAGPAVAGGFELALWCDVRVMEESAYFGVYCRRWGVPLIDGGTVRLPRIVGMGRAMEIILTGRKVPAEEALRIGACEHVVPEGKSREFAEAMAHEIARFPQACVRADRRSAYMQQGLAAARGDAQGVVQRLPRLRDRRRRRRGALRLRQGAARGFSRHLSRFRPAAPRGSARARHRSSMPQRAISSSVRAQPRHRPRCGSIWQTLMQGDFTAFL